MDTSDKIALIEDCMDIEPGTLKMEDRITDFEEWDSLTALSIIASVAEQTKKNLTGEALKKVVTVSDLVKLID